MYFEHKNLYRSIREDVSDDFYTVEIGKARVVESGDDLSIITYGMGVHWAMEVAKNHPEISIDIVDLRTLAPLDTESIYASVRKTGKVIVLHEDSLTGGIGGELLSLISENCFQDLDAPVRRVGSLDTPIPFINVLEDNFLPKQRLVDAVLELYRF